jgi:hypothetical protein
MTFLTYTETVETAIEQAAIALQAHFMHEEGERYRVEDLQQALNHWLELSLEALADDALFHTIEGDRAYAFNRRAFELELRRIQPLQETVPDEREIRACNGTESERQVKAMAA